MTRVKICGLTREEDVDAVADAGAHAIGFISGFPSSPRNLSIERAASLMSRLPLFANPVLVTTGDVLVQNSDAIKRMAPKTIQLYGNSFSAETIRNAFHARLIRTYSVGREGEENSDAVSKSKDIVRGYDALLVDTKVQGREGGGTGLTSDWAVCAAIRKGVAPLPFILSGGLRPENVEAAIAAVSPFCVDVSSGVESAPGVKDSSKVKALIAKATAAEGTNSATMAVL
jgi:phosphoribosylanthranilate isomerase